MRLTLTEKSSTVVRVDFAILVWHGHYSNIDERLGAYIGIY